MSKEEWKALEWKGGHVAMKGSRPVKCEAPPPAPLKEDDKVVVLNMKKRDLRSIEDVQGEILEKKKKGEEGGEASQPK